MFTETCKRRLLGCQRVRHFSGPLAVLQRLESFAAVGRMVGKRQQADIQAGGRRGHEREHCVEQLTYVLMQRMLNDRQPQKTAPNTP